MEMSLSVSEITLQVLHLILTWFVFFFSNSVWIRLSFGLLQPVDVDNKRKSSVFVLFYAFVFELTMFDLHR